MTKKRDGMTLLELLIAMLILVFVTIGFMKAMSDFLLYLKADKINLRAKELAEKLKGDLLNRSYKELIDCFNPQNSLYYTPANFSLNSTFFVKNCNHSCTGNFSCTYCYTGEEIKPSNVSTCTGGYPIRIGYNAAKLMYTDGGDKEIGLVIGVKIYYNETKTKKEKEINFYIYKMADE